MSIQQQHQQTISNTTVETPLIQKGDIKNKLYPQRWLALTIFGLHEITNNMMWIMFSPITTIASCYYNVSLFWINSLSWIFMLTYIVFLIPATWFLESFGLRATAIVGVCLNTIGGWIRFAGSSYNSFWILMTGQFVTSLPFLLETNACSKLSAVWFPPNERTFATTMFAVVSAQCGVLIGVLVTPFVITGGIDTDIVCNTTLHLTFEDKYQWLSVTQKQFLYYYLFQAILTTLTFPITFLIPEAPPTPPSDSAPNERSKSSLYTSYVLAFTNIHFIGFVFVYGVFVAVSAAYMTVFQEVLYNAGYSHYQNVIGYLGTAITVTSVVCLIGTSRWIDHSKRYYSSSVFACFLPTIFTIVLSVLIQLHQTFYLVFIAATLTGGSLSLLGAIGFEYAVEMTYPLSEGISASILNVFTMLFSILMVIGVGQLVQHSLASYGMYLFSGALLLAALIMLFIKPTLRRSKLDYHTNQHRVIVQ